jgi:hypothetical protein
VLTVRPKVAELAFQLYGRPLHPELFEVVETCTIECGSYAAKIDITAAGHVVTWRYAGLTLTEVAASAHQPLPKMRRLLSHSLKDRRNDGVQCRGGVSYRVQLQSRTSDPKSFWTFARKLNLEERKRGLLHRFDTNRRITSGAISYIDFKPRDCELFLRAIHTFPDDYAVVETQSLFKLP